MTAPEPIHPGEHLAEIVEELGITLPPGKDDGRAANTHSRYRPLPQVHHGGYSAANRKGIGNYPRLLAESAAHIRP